MHGAVAELAEPTALECHRIRPRQLGHEVWEAEEIHDVQRLELNERGVAKLGLAF